MTTGIFKKPVSGAVKVRRLGIVGDQQADLTVHGGPEKAVYAYPSEHYEAWSRELNRELQWGMFGENLTTEGLLEKEIHVGDEFRVGSTTLAITRPRFPCFKLGIKFGTMDMVSRFHTSNRSGFYLSVREEGEVQTGDGIDLLRQNAASPTILEVFESEKE